MSVYDNLSTGYPNPAEQYAVAGVTANGWVSIAVPSGINLVQATATVQCIVQQATNATLPSGSPNGVGSVLQELFSIGEDTTYLHFYSLGAAGNIFLNYYEK